MKPSSNGSRCSRLPERVAVDGRELGRHDPAQQPGDVRANAASQARSQLPNVAATPRDGNTKALASRHPGGSSPAIPSNETSTSARTRSANAVARAAAKRSAAGDSQHRRAFDSERVEDGGGILHPIGDAIEPTRIGEARARAIWGDHEQA
jgi:hypothetical protein